MGPTGFHFPPACFTRSRMATSSKATRIRGRRSSPAWQRASRRSWAASSMQRLALGGTDRYAGRSAGLRRALGRQIFEGDAATAPQSFSRSGNATQELRMVFQSIVEPVVLALEPDQHASRFAVPRNEDFFGLGQAE